MANVLECQDRWGRIIVLADQTWNGHILDDHAEMASNLYAIEQTTMIPSLEAQPPIDLSKAVFSYDRESDTLMLHLYGRGHRAVSIETGDNVYVRFDRMTDQVVGFQLENFLRAIAPKHPELLNHADVFGIDREDAARDQPEAFSEARRRAALASLEPLVERRLVAASVF